MEKIKRMLNLLIHHDKAKTDLIFRTISRFTIICVAFLVNYN